MRAYQFCLIGLFGLVMILSGRFTPARAVADPENSPVVSDTSDHRQAATPFTNVSGLITQDTTWSKAGSPYVVVQSIRVQEGVKLIIEPGVEIRFSGNYFLDIDGTLVAVGTAESPIVFTSGANSPAPGDWGVRTASHLAGINFRETSVDAALDTAGNYVSGSVIRYSRIEYGTGISMNAAAPLIENNLIRRNSGIGVFYNGYMGLNEPAAYIRSNWVTDNVLGFSLWQGRVHFTNNLVTRNIGASWGGIGGSIQGNTFACNGVNIGYPSMANVFILSAFSNPAEIRNNNFIDNGAIDVGLRFDGQDLGLSNNYWGTSDLSAIQNRIYDQRDDLDIPGLVTIEPILPSAVPPLFFDPLCPLSGYILSVKDGDWNDAQSWNLGRVPTASDTVVIQPDHTVTVSLAVGIEGLLNLGVLRSRTGVPLQIHATGFISNSGQILGSDGRPGDGAACGSAGGSIELRGSPIDNSGTIQAGKGGDGVQCGGSGGSSVILGRDTTNTGEILGGDGGNVLGDLSGYGGQGGETHIWGKWGGPGFLINRGLTRGGNGGSGNEAATEKQRGGNGGRLKLISFPDVHLDGGRHYGGIGGRGTGDGANGTDGTVIIEPNVISLAGADTAVSGGDIVIFGGDDTTLDFRNMRTLAISATGNITLAVGTGGSVDLRGNTQPILQATGNVVIASNSISVSEGVALGDLVNAGNMVIMPAMLLADVSLLGPGTATGQGTIPMSLTLTVLNGAPIQDTFHLTSTFRAEWLVDGLPSSVIVPGLDGVDLTLRLTPPATALPGETIMIAVTATSQNDASVVATERIEIDIITNRYPLGVGRDGNGTGIVVSAPPGIDCGGDCTEDYLHATIVTLTATANTGSVFTGWAGACVGDGPCQVTMDAAKTVTATFNAASQQTNAIFLPLVSR